MTAEKARLVPMVSRLRKARVLTVGDVMLDHFHYGSVERISPEAPIPVLRVERETTMLGGAGNVVRNLVALGAEARFVTVVGDDDGGRTVATQIKDQGVPDHPIVEIGRRTSTKTRYIAGVQQVLRADRETTVALRDDAKAELLAAARNAIRDCQALVISDYGKGVLSNDVLMALIEMARKAKKTVVIDPKGVDFACYRGADVITPNRRELADAAAMPTNTDDEVIAAAQHLIKEHGFGAVIATRSADGMTVVTAKGTAAHLPAEAREVFDVSGAGDTVVAAVAAAVAVGIGLAEAAALANVAAGIVVGKVGTAVAYAADVIGTLHHQDLTSAEAKLLTPKQAKDRIQVWRRGGRKIGFTNGCFDLLHPGHLSLLKQAKAACDRLVVGLNSDASVARFKGDGRPVQSEAARATVLASLETVDAVVIFEDDTPLALIEAFRPDVLVKGADYDLAQVVGADVVKGYGGRVLLAKLEPGYSTSATIAKLGGNKKKESA
ncbi:MAG: D-glycero-beta-D-manno-heptose-7-phosphate kinase [Rhodospirillales bacterium]|nr:D-glycero-beta-D-manno-heptose-7-phosphate kinase [Rhodospirillales bacterium]